MGQGARARGFGMKSEKPHSDAASSERRTESGQQRIELPRSSVQLAGTDIHTRRVVLPVDALQSRDERPSSMAVDIRPAPLPAFDVARASSSPAKKTTRSALREARNAALLFALLTLITSTAAVLIAAGFFR